MDQGISSAMRNRSRAALAATDPLFRWLDWFVPRATLDEPGEELLRARLTVVAGLGGGFAFMVSTATAMQTPAPEFLYTGVALAVAYFAIPVAQRYSERPTLLRHALMGLTAVFAMSLCIMTGGRDLGGILIAIMLPLVAVLISGARAGILWSVALLVCVVGTGVAIQSGYDPPLHADPEVEALWSLWAGAAILVLSLGIALTYDRLRQSTLNMLEAERLRADIAYAQQLDGETRFRTRLEALVEERSQELLESRERLRRADRLASIGTLAAGVAHQINNPVGSILMSAQFALGEGDAEDRERIYREALESNAEHAQRCGRIVHNLLAFARNAPTEKLRIDLNELVRTSLESVPLPTAGFDLRISPRSLPIMASNIEVEQVIVNLVRNALESGQPADERIVIETDARADYAVIHVTDQGRGIEPDDRERIFDPFFTTRIREGGTGLGLSMVHTIVEDHGGRINVLSKPGAGTQFSVSFPLAAEPAVDSPRVVPVSAPA